MGHVARNTLFGNFGAGTTQTSLLSHEHVHVHVEARLLKLTCSTFRNCAFQRANTKAIRCQYNM